MANQYTCENYSVDEINEIISLYVNGMSFSKIGIKLKRKKPRIREILKDEGVWVEGRDTRKKPFSEKEIKNILNLYLNEMWGTRKISQKYNVSVGPIKRILVERNLLRKGNSDGKKIILSEEQKEKIRVLYLDEKKNYFEIGEELGLKRSMIEKHISTVNYRRTKSEAISMGLRKRVFTSEMIENMKKGQRKLVLSGKRKQTGGVCIKYVVNGITCQGTYEKRYLECLIENNEKLPENCSYINTPFGAYYPDFKYDDRFIEIKSDYTYDVLYGIKKSRWTKKYETTQLKKIEWVNENILPLEIIVVEKNKMKIHKIK